MAGLSPEDNEVINSYVPFEMTVKLCILKLMNKRVIDIDIDHYEFFAAFEKNELMATFILVDGNVSPLESLWLDLDNVREHFLKRIKIDPGYWAKSPSDILSLVHEHVPEMADDYAQRAITLAEAICKLDDEISPAKAKLLSHFKRVLASHSNLKFEPEELETEDSLRDINLPSQKITLEDIFKDLDAIIGLDHVKNDVKQLVNLLNVRVMRQKAGLAIPEISLHLVFTGNPGTGKTMMARLLGRIYAALGVLSKGHLVEVSRQDMVAGYIGQTAMKTTDVFRSAIGGVLFIDEAYSLNRGGEDYGQEAIDALVKLMEDHRDEVVVIVAGYSEEMNSFLMSNPGLPSRFKRVMSFPDYSNDEMMAIFCKIMLEGGYELSADGADQLRLTLASLPRNKNFGNGRLVRKIFENAIGSHANRMATVEEATVIDLSTLTKEDIFAP